MHDRRLPLRRVTPANLILVADPGLVTPIYKSLLRLRAAGALRIFPLHSALNGRVRTLRRARQRLLWCETPAGQIEPHRRLAQIFAQTAADQFPDHPRSL